MAKQFLLVAVLGISIVVPPLLFAGENKTPVITEGLGTGDIVVGRSNADDVISKYGKKYALENNEGYSSQLTYKKSGLSFYYCANDSAKKIFLIEFKKGSTAKGIIVGKSRLKDLSELYGEPAEIGQSEGFWIYQYTGIQFYFRILPGNKKDEEDSVSSDARITDADVVPNDTPSNFCDDSVKASRG